MSVNALPATIPDAGDKAENAQEPQKSVVNKPEKKGINPVQTVSKVSKNPKKSGINFSRGFEDIITKSIGGFLPQGSIQPSDLQMIKSNPVDSTAKSPPPTNTQSGTGALQVVSKESIDPALVGGTDIDMVAEAKGKQASVTDDPDPEDANSVPLSQAQKGQAGKQASVTDDPDPEDANSVRLNQAQKTHKELREEQRQEINRIMRYGPRAFYEILGFSRDQNYKQIQHAYDSITQHALRKMYLAVISKIHTDKADDADAKEATARVNDAWEILKDEAKRKVYNTEELPKLLESGGLGSRGDVGESFAPNAWAPDDDNIIDDDDSLFDPEQHQTDQEQEMRSIVYDAAPIVQEFLIKNHKHSTWDQLEAEKGSGMEKINKKLADLQRAAGFSKEQLLSIPWRAYAEWGLEVSKAWHDLRNAPSDENLQRQMLRHLSADGTKTIQNESLPEWWQQPLAHWTGAYDELKAKTSQSANTEGLHGSQSQRGGDKMDGVEGTSAAPKPPPPEMSGAGSQGSQMNLDEDPSDGNGIQSKSQAAVSTDDGGLVVGYRPFERTLTTGPMAGLVVPIGYQFLIFYKGHPNPLSLISGEKVGRTVVDRYLNLPANQIIDLRYTDKKATAASRLTFRKIHGFAVKEGDYHGAGFRPGYTLAEFEGERYEVLSRTALRKVLGRADADKLIDKTYIDIGATPPSQVKEINKHSKAINLLVQSGLNSLPQQGVHAPALLSSLKNQGPTPLPPQQQASTPLSQQGAPAQGVQISALLNALKQPGPTPLPQQQAPTPNQGNQLSAILSALNPQAPTTLAQQEAPAQGGQILALLNSLKLPPQQAPTPLPQQQAPTPNQGDQLSAILSALNQQGPTALLPQQANAPLSQTTPAPQQQALALLPQQQAATSLPQQGVQMSDLLSAMKTQQEQIAAQNERIDRLSTMVEALVAKNIGESPTTQRGGKSPQRLIGTSDTALTLANIMGQKDPSPAASAIPAAIIPKSLPPAAAPQLAESSKKSQELSADQILQGLLARYQQSVSGN